MNYYALFFAVLIGSTAALPTNVIERGEEVPVFSVPEVTYDDNLDWRVVGGSNAASGQFPYIASLRSGTSHFCGGVLISNVYILSAAHCTVGAAPTQIAAVVGTTTLNTGGTRYAISRIVNHPNYNSNTISNDVSLLRTASTITFNNLVSSIPITNTVVAGGFSVTLSGWGRTVAGGSLPNNLQFVVLQTLGNADCQQRLGQNPIFESSICTLTQAGEGACNGDSGGPLVYNNFLIGTVSWGIPCGLGYPDVYARTSSFSTWITSNAT